ncbi:uncharacterized protein V1518DRAFT_275360 [Limtongia smithiae]|uniref:uncharacterized protein n=1 Tax=Limtongia smithiae TaxID=1125753 RepID=UPI0034CF0673
MHAFSIDSASDIGPESSVSASRHRRAMPPAVLSAAPPPSMQAGRPLSPSTTVDSNNSEHGRGSAWTPQKMYHSRARNVIDDSDTESRTTRASEMYAPRLRPFSLQLLDTSILDAFFEVLPQGTLKTLAETNRFFNSIVTPLLYRYPKFYTPPALTAFVQTITNSRVLADHVRTINLTFDADLEKILELHVFAENEVVWRRPLHAQAANKILSSPLLYEELFRNCTRVTDVTLYGHNLSTHHLELIAPYWTHLLRLRIIACQPNWNPTVMTYYSKRLQKLELEGHIEASARTLRVLSARLKDLDTLTYSTTILSASEVAASVSNFKNLTSLSLIFVPDLSDFAVEEILNSNWKLERLKIIGCPRISVHSVSVILESAVNLIECDIRLAQQRVQTPDRPMLHAAPSSKASLQISSTVLKYLTLANIPRAIAPLPVTERISLKGCLNINVVSLIASTGASRIEFVDLKIDCEYLFSPSQGGNQILSRAVKHLVLGNLDRPLTTNMLRTLLAKLPNLTTLLIRSAIDMTDILDFATLETDDGFLLFNQDAIKEVTEFAFVKPFVVTSEDTVAIARKLNIPTHQLIIALKETCQLMEDPRVADPPLLLQQSMDTQNEKFDEKGGSMRLQTKKFPKNSKNRQRARGLLSSVHHVVDEYAEDITPVMQHAVAKPRRAENVPVRAPLAPTQVAPPRAVPAPVVPLPPGFSAVPLIPRSVSMTTTASETDISTAEAAMTASAMTTTGQMSAKERASLVRGITTRTLLDEDESYGAAERTTTLVPMQAMLIPSFSQSPGFLVPETVVEAAPKVGESNLLEITTLRRDETADFFTTEELQRTTSSETPPGDNDDEESDDRSGVHGQREFDEDNFDGYWDETMAQEKDLDREELPQLVNAEGGPARIDLNKNEDGDDDDDEEEDVQDYDDEELVMTHKAREQQEQEYEIEKSREEKEYIKRAEAQAAIAVAAARKQLGSSCADLDNEVEIDDRSNTWLKGTSQRIPAPIIAPGSNMSTLILRQSTAAMTVSTLGGMDGDYISERSRGEYSDNGSESEASERERQLRQQEDEFNARLEAEEAAASAKRQSRGRESEIDMEYEPRGLSPGEFDETGRPTLEEVSRQIMEKFQSRWGQWDTAVDDPRLIFKDEYTPEEDLNYAHDKFTPRLPVIQAKKKIPKNQKLRTVRQLPVPVEPVRKRAELLNNKSQAVATQLFGVQLSTMTPWVSGMQSGNAVGGDGVSRVGMSADGNVDEARDDDGQRD